MGKRGPAPKPTALRLIDGDRADRINANEPVPRSGEVVCPPDVAPEVGEVFNRVLAELEAMRIDAPADRDALLCYAEAVVIHRRACRQIADQPLVIKSNGATIRNPVLVVQRDAAQQVRAFAQEFGLTPSARSRIETSNDGADDENPFAATH